MNRRDGFTFAGAIAAAGVLCWSAGSVAGEDIQTNAAMKTLAELAPEKNNDQEKRLSLHLLLHGTRGPDATNALVANPALLDKYPDIKLQFVLMGLDKSKEKEADLKKMRRTMNSPMIATCMQDFMNKRAGGSLTLPSYDVKTEPFWVPAILAHIRHNWGFLNYARYGAAALEMVPEGSSDADTIMLRMHFSERPESRRGRGLAEAIHQGFITLESPGKDNPYYKADGPRYEAALLRHAGKTNESLKVYTELLTSGQANAASYNGLALLYESMGRQQDAENAILDGLKKFPEKNSALLVTAARYAAKRGDDAKAIEYLRACLKGSPEYPPAHIMLAELEAKRGNRDAAIQSCADAMAYSYGWGDEYMDRVTGALQVLLKQKRQKP